MKQIQIGNNTYNVRIAETEEERIKGLSDETWLPKDSGMLFIYDEPQEEIGYTMEDTGIPLDIVFIDEDQEVISVHTVCPFSEEPIIEKNVKWVLEVNPFSKIKEGDYLDLDPEKEPEEIPNKQLLVLDPEGDPQGTIEAGARIFSRISTKKLITLALKAYKSDEEKDYKKLGRAVIKEIQAQDSRDPEYVEV